MVERRKEEGKSRATITPVGRSKSRDVSASRATTDNSVNVINPKKKSASRNAVLSS